MKYPDYSGYPDRGPDLVQASIAAIGTPEPDNNEAIAALNHNDPHYASLLVGRACRTLVAAHAASDRTADRLLGKADRALQPLISAPDRRTGAGASVAQLADFITLLKERNDPAAMQRFQRATHGRAVRELGRLRGRMGHGGTKKTHAGAKTHWRSLAFINRLASPFLVAGSSLPHLDNSHRHEANYDVLMAEGGPETSDPLTHLVQLKYDCLGFCGDSKGQAFGDLIRSGYGRNITFASHCCDIETPFRTRLGKRHLDAALLRELEGSASQAEVEALNMVSNGLSLILTSAGKHRRGTRRVRRIQPYRPTVTPYTPPTPLTRPTPLHVAAHAKRPAPAA
jgi:hypothetical protein